GGCRSEDAGEMNEQPDPKPNDLPAVWDLVLAAMKDRDAVGRERYGVPLQPFNGRRALRDLAEELLDATVYTFQEIYERDALEKRIGDAVEMLRGMIVRCPNCQGRGDVLSLCVAGTRTVPCPACAGLRSVLAVLTQKGPESG